MVNNKVKSDIGQVHLFDHIVKLGSGQHFERIPVNVEDFIRLNFGMTGLHQALVSKVLILWVLGVNSILLGVQPISFFVPLLLYNLNDSIFGGLPLGGRIARLSMNDCRIVRLLLPLNR
jgi:hypothetical protein